MQDVRTRIVVVVSKRWQVSAVSLGLSLWAHHFICKRQKYCLPDEFSVGLDFWRYIGSCVWMQRCGWINPAAHRTTTHTQKKRIKSLIVVVSFSSIGLWFFFITFCFFLSFSYMILCVLLPFLCCSFFSVFDLRLLLASGTAIFLAEAHREGKVSRRRRQVYQAHVVRLIHRRIDPFADQHSRIEWLCSWSLALDFLPGGSLTLYIYPLDLP